jgi:tripartite-type tricarboxylate transporter receptor subunit TctC
MAGPVRDMLADNDTQGRSIMARLAYLFLALVWLGIVPVSAQEAFPSRPITIIVPFPPGGIADLTARPLASAMEKVLKQPVIVANKPGAAGTVGTQQAAIAKPDGYTVLLAVPNISTAPEVDAVFGRTPVFKREQFVAIARLSADPPILVVNSEQPWKTLKELVGDPRASKGEIVFSSSGPYGASHVPMEMLLHAAGMKMRHLPTTGGGPATTAVLGNHAAMWTSPPSLAAPHFEAGKLRWLAHFGATRLADFPEVPTLKELGYDIEYYLWAGLFTQKPVPGPVLQILRQAVAKAVDDPEFKAAMAKAKTPIAYQDGPEFQAWWDEDARKLAEAIRRIGRVEGQ